MIIADDSPLLADLLAEKLPRGRRCGSCFSYDPAISDPTTGGCMALVPPWGGCSAGDWCSIWEPSEESGLDAGGVPLGAQQGG